LIWTLQRLVLSLNSRNSIKILIMKVALQAMGTMRRKKRTREAVRESNATSNEPLYISNLINWMWLWGIMLIIHSCAHHNYSKLIYTNSLA